MQQDVIDLEEQRRREMEDRRKEDAIKLANQPRRQYIPVKGDPVDEMMAKYINEAPYYVPVERIAEGNYMWGSKKIFAKIMNGRLIIRVGGGYMLIDEFLKHFENELRSTN